MGIIQETNEWVEGIFSLDLTSPAMGGADGPLNLAAKQLAGRTRYLKQRTDEVDEAKEGAATLKERIRAAGSAPRPLYMRPFIPDVPVAASTGSVDTAAGGLLEIDGVQTQAGDLIFLKDQSNSIENGYWEVQTGAWNRYIGYGNGSTTCFSNVLIDINAGTVNKGRVYVIDADSYVVGSSALIFRESFMSSTKRPGTVMLRGRNGEVQDVISDQIGGYDYYKERNLLTVLGVNSITEVMTELRRQCNGIDTPDFSGLRIGDYLDLPSLTVADTVYSWNDTYQNLRLVLSGFNVYKGYGSPENTKNHILFTFKNCPLTRAIHSSSSNTGGYNSTTMKTFLDVDFKAGLIAALGGDFTYSVMRYMSGKGTSGSCTASVFLPTLHEVSGYGFTTYSDDWDAWANLRQYPIFRSSAEYLIKRYNGARQWWWVATPYSGDTASFCAVHSTGTISVSSASSVGGVAPAFCVA
jgi:hypothetical protein